MSTKLEKLEASVEKLQKQVTKLLEKQGDLNRSASSYVEKIGEGDNLWQSTYGSVKSMYSKLLDFSTNLQDQYKSAEQLAKTFNLSLASSILFVTTYNSPKYSLIPI